MNPTQPDPYTKTLVDFNKQINSMAESFLKSHYTKLIKQKCNYKNSKTTLVSIQEIVNHLLRYYPHEPNCIEDEYAPIIITPIKDYITKNDNENVQNMILYSSWIIDENKRKIVTGNSNKQIAIEKILSIFIDSIAIQFLKICPFYWGIFFTDSQRYATTDDIDIPIAMYENTDLVEMINPKNNKTETQPQFNSIKEAIRIRDIIKTQYEIIKTKQPLMEIHAINVNTNIKDDSWAIITPNITNKIISSENTLEF